MDRCINLNNSRVQEIAKALNIPPALAAVKVEVWMDKNGGKIPTIEDLDSNYQVNYNLKSVEILSSDKAKQVFVKAEKAGWDLSKTLTELQIPKPQKELILSLGKTKLDDIITDLLANYSYTVEINTAKQPENYDNIAQGFQEIFDYNNDQYFYDEWDGYFKNGEKITKKEFQEAKQKSISEIPTQHYSNLTVPGGTNYTENEIATPAITPSIKGHAQFATDNGIGWFRSDDRMLNRNEEKVPDGWGSINNPNIVHNEGTPTKTRRILEVQSDLFQKGRDRKGLTKDTSEIKQEPLPGEVGFFLETVVDKKNFNNTTSNQFLQLLNKDNNWVTFFIKSIIQDSAKKGYEKVLFPRLDTIIQIESQGKFKTYEEAEKHYKTPEWIVKNDEAKKELDEAKALTRKSEQWLKWVSEGNKWQTEETYKDSEFEAWKKDRVSKAYENWHSLQPSLLNTAKFYEYELANRLDDFAGGNKNDRAKGIWALNQITDEYGNTWNEVTLDINRDKSISFSKEEDDFNLEKLVSEKTANNQIEELTAKYPNYTFYKEKDTRLRGFNTWSVYAKPKPDSKGQFTLFTGDKNIRPNVITTVDRGTMADNKFKTFLGSNISDAQTALKKIAKLDSGMAPIAQKLLRSNLNTPIEIVDVDFFTRDNLPDGVKPDAGMKEDFRGGGFYSKNNRKIYIARGAKSPAVPILLHEILHANTTHYISSNPNSPAVKKLESLLKHLKEQSKKGLITNTYPLTDLDELLTGVFTNKDFIDELKMLPATSKNFKSIWDEILQIFKVIFGVKETSLLDEVFATAAQITESSIDEFLFGAEESQLASETFTPIFSQEEDIQGIISNRLDKLSTKAKNINGEYVVEGYDINWKRPSSIAKAIIGGFTSGIKSDAQIEREKLYQDAGTILHAIQANVIKKNFPEYNQLVEDYEVPVELTEMAEVVEAQLKPIIQAAKDRGSIMKAEVFLGNVKSQKAGTADLLEITKDGKYYTYDLKTRFTTDKSGVSRFNKIHEWSLQTNEYNKMLESGDADLGVVKGKVLGTYVLEFTVEPKADKIVFAGNVGFTGTRPEKYLANRKMKSFTIVAPTFLRTKDAKIDEMINKLLKQTEELKKFRGGTEIQKEAKNQVLLSKLQLLQDLQLRKDVSKLLDAASLELSYIQELIESGNIQEEQQFIKEQLGLYSNLRSYFTGAPDELRIKMYKVQDLALDLNDKFLQMGKETIVEAANSTGITGFVNDVFAAVKDINWMRKMVTGVSNVDNPLVATAYRTVTIALAKSRDKIQIMADTLMAANNELREYLGKIDYSMMIDGDELVQQFTKDFFKDKKVAEKKGNYEWFEDNVTYNNSKYLEAREKQLNYQETFGKKSYANYLKLENPTMSADEIDLAANKEVAKRMQEWDANNKNNKTKYFTPKNKWLNPKWLEIKQGKYKGTAVEKFYNLYLSYLEVANSIAPDKKFTKGFIANFSRTFIEKTAANGLLGAIKGNASGLLDELAPGYDDAYGQRDIITGEPVRSLYIPGTSDVKQEKSLDLAASMFKFMEGVYRYEELKDVEKVVIAVKQQLKSAKFLQTDKLGNVVKTGVTEGITIENSNTYQMFEAWSDAVLYGQYKKGDIVFKISGNGFGKLLGLKKGEEKAISVGKIIDGFIKYTSIRNLGFNLYSPITNLFGGTTNQYITGASGAYYSTTDLDKAYGLILGGKTNFPNEDTKKVRLILDWLKINTGEFSQDTSNKLSAFKANKLLADWNSMTLMRESESLIQEAGAIAMILSGKHGVTMGDFNLVDGKLETNLDIYKREALRQKIIRINNKNIGGINNDDLMMAKTYITGRLLMQHRSWLPALFYSRFGQKQKDYVLEQDIEGRYVTAYRLFKYYFNKSKFQQLEEFEKGNMKEAATEAALILATGTLLFLLKAGLDDDDKEEAYYKITTKISSRFLSELTFFVDPTLQSQYQILLKPAAAAGTIEDLGRFVGSLFNEVTGTEKEKEKNKPGKKALKLIPGVNKVESFLNDLGISE